MTVPSAGLNRALSLSNQVWDNSYIQFLRKIGAFVDHRSKGWGLA